MSWGTVWRAFGVDGQTKEWRGGVGLPNYGGDSGMWKSRQLYYTLSSGF